MAEISTPANSAAGSALFVRSEKTEEGVSPNSLKISATADRGQAQVILTISPGGRRTACLKYLPAGTPRQQRLQIIHEDREQEGGEEQEAADSPNNSDVSGEEVEGTELQPQLASPQETSASPAMSQPLQEEKDDEAEGRERPPVVIYVSSGEVRELPTLLWQRPDSTGNPGGYGLVP